MTMSHEIAECVSQKVNKSWKFNSCSTHQPTFDDKSELKVITQQDQLKCSQRDWNCKAKFVHTSKIIKVGTQTDVRDFCARTLLFLEVVWLRLRSVSNSTIWNFSTMDFAPKFCSILKKRILGFASFLLPLTFYKSREKQPAESQIKSKKIVAHLGFRILYFLKTLKIIL